ncbi:MAG: alkylhydroperoxidase domain protein [Dehalococcoidia bacterium]
MTQPNVTNPDVSQSDILNALLGIDDASPLASLRAQRPEATNHTAGSYRALFVDTPTTAVTPIERFAAALRVAALHEEPALAGHYAGQLRATTESSEQLVAAVQDGASAATLPPRLRAILAHADLLVIRPAAATPADLTALRTAGLSDPEIVTISQLIAFVSFQLRVLIGLSLLRGDRRPVPATTLGPKDATNAGFTQAELGWAPWIAPVEAADATDEQRAVLPGQRIDSPYFRLLALDPPVLGERTATDLGIFYTHGGLPRPDRELAATVTSRVNGCIYCASVHSRRAAQLSGRTDDVQRLLDEGITTTLDDRWRAITDLAAALTVTPPAATQDHLQRLRELGLQDLDILDTIQSAAFFSWANRLMLTLGEPVRPAQ